MKNENRGRGVAGGETALRTIAGSVRLIGPMCAVWFIYKMRQELVCEQTVCGVPSDCLGLGTFLFYFVSQYRLD